MMQRCSRTVLLALCLLAVLSLSCEAVPRAHPLHPERWIGPARQAGSNRKQARSVILDAYLAKDPVSAAKAFETLSKERPGDATRRALYAYAVMMSLWMDPNNPEEKRMRGEVSRSLLNAVEGPDRYVPERYRRRFTPSTVPEDWLALGVLAGNREYIQKAAHLDPMCAEAYYYLADLTIHDQQWKEAMRKYRPDAWEQLAKAERIEPKLHPLAVRIRAYLCALSGEYARSAGYMREYLRLWPDAPRVQNAREMIVIMEREAKKVK